jgi:competence protein ComEA
MLKKILILVTTIFALFAFQSAFAAVEINTADQAALDGIAGIGPATSRAILDERKKNGNFKDWPDLEQRVRGIGDRNSVKLSAAGLVVNGQPKNTSMTADKPAKPAKMSAESTKTSQQKN